MYLACSGVFEKGMYFCSGPMPAGLEREYECVEECCGWLMVLERVGSVYEFALLTMFWVGTVGAVFAEEGPGRWAGWRLPGNVAGVL